MLFVTSEVIETRIVKELKEASHFAIMLDYRLYDHGTISNSCTVYQKRNGGAKIALFESD